MKNILFLFLLVMFFSCQTNPEDKSATDSMNAIEDRPLQDTSVAPFPDGYAPPNTDIDTSARVKDSIKKAQQ
jgi:protein-tyrosine phosphatase